jgi:periplasmic protein TonB
MGLRREVTSGRIAGDEVMSYQDFTEDEKEKGFLKRNGLIIGIVAVVVIFGGAAGILLKMYGKVPPPHKPEEIVIHLQPPPPLPPPPPPPSLPPPPQQPKLVEQPPIKPDEPKPKDEPKTPDKPPGPPAPAASGPPSDFGLGGAGGGGGTGDGGGGGSKYGWYAAEVIVAIKARIEANDKTSKANFHGLKTRIWADKNGRIIKATVSGTTGDPVVDEALKNEVLVGLQLQEPPPDDMPMPIVLRVSEQRAN